MDGGSVSPGIHYFKRPFQYRKGLFLAPLMLGYTLLASKRRTDVSNSIR
jgi:hypothetical protein